MEGWAAKLEITTKGTKEHGMEAGHRSKNNHEIHERTLKEVSLNEERDFY
jgi:hypothetical protein